MEESSGTKRSPVNTPIAPRRPPRPVSFMPIVPEYPPSIRNASLHDEQPTRTASVWSADDDDLTRKRCAAFFHFRDEPAPEVTRGRGNEIGRDAKKRQWLLLGLILIAVILAAVVGGVFGGRALSSKGEDKDAESAIAHTSWSETSVTSTGSAKTTSSSSPAATGVKPTIQKESRLASAIAMPFENPFRITVFISSDGNLATSIWTGSRMESFAVMSAADDNFPKPLTASPLHLIILGHSDDVHILYVDEDLYLCLATMSPRNSDRGKALWKGGHLETGKDGTENSQPEKHQTTADLRVTYKIHDNAEDTVSGRSADRVSILFEDGSKQHRGKDTYTLLSTVTPDDPSQWFVSRYQLREDDDDNSMKPQPGSQGFALVPIFRNMKGESWGQSGVRIIWDSSNGDHNSTFGVTKCKMENATYFSGCWSDMENWGSNDEHKELLSKPKPFDLAIQRIPARDKAAPQNFFLLILDGDNFLSELYWDGKRWDGMRRFSAIDDDSSNATHAFSSVAVTPDGHLFGVADGKLMWYRRTGDWWDDDFYRANPGWRLMDVVNTTLVDAGAG